MTQRYRDIGSTLTCRYRAIQKENVDVHFTPVEKITEKGVVGGDGVERECDTIVCATGFDVSYRPRFPIVGKNGVELANKWKICPEGESASHALGGISECWNAN